MATEDILIRYRADVSQLETDINKVIASQEELTKATNQNTQAQQKAVNSAEFAAKKRAQLLQQEEARLVKLREAQKRAFDPAEIEKFNKKIDESNRKIALLSGTAAKQRQELGALSRFGANAFNNIATAAVAAFSVDAILNFTKTAVDAFARLESAQITFQTLVGNAELADQIFKELKEFSIRTPFQAEDVQAAAKTLIQFGVNVTEVVDTVKILGDISAGTGKNIQELSVIFGQIASTGRLTGQDLLQLINAGFNPLQIISEKTGKSIATLKKELERGNITFDQVKDAFKSATEEGGKFFDLTNKLGSTTAGQLSTLQDETDQLAASIGRKLAPSWIAAKKAFLEFVDALVTTRDQQKVDNVQKNISALGDAVRAEVEGQQEFIQKSVADPLEARYKAIEGVRKRINREIDQFVGASTEEGQRRVANARYELDALNDLEEATKAEAKAAVDAAEQKKKADEEATRESGEKRIAQAKKTAAEVKKLLDDLDSEIRKVQSDLSKAQIEILPEESQQQQEEKIKLLGELTKQEIEGEIELRKKAVREDKDLTDQQKNDILAKFDELKAKRLELARFNDQVQLDLISKEQIERIEAAFKEIDDLNIEQALVIEADKVEAANEAVAKSFEDLGNAISREDFEAAKDAATARTVALNQALSDEADIFETSIKNNRDAELAKVKDGDAAAAEREAINLKADNAIEENNKKVLEKIGENNQALNNQITEQTARATQARIDLTFEVLNATSQVLSELSSLYSQFSAQRISEIEEQSNLQLEALQQADEFNKQNLEERAISEREFLAEQTRIENERVKLEKETEQKIREEKRKQAILDKAAALAQIAINTAVAVTKVTAEAALASPFLIPLIIAQGVIQAGIVAATPIPYRKGSKNTGDNPHMARVGEEGEEFIWMPSNSKVLPARQTKRYSDAIDAMYDNRLDDFIYKNYVTPALMNQKQKSEAEGQRSFADNLAKSIYFNGGLNATDMEQIRRKGQRINNVDEIAEAIARKLPLKDIYRA